MCDLSVIMSVYHEKEEYLKLSIESIINQTYDRFEFIIVLDAPENKLALSIIRHYESIDSRIKILINDSNLGLALSLNKAVGISKGRYLVRMDADDISMPDRFQKQIKFMDENSEISVLGINKIEINQSGETISKGASLPNSPHKTAKILKYSNIIVHPGVFIRKSDFNQIGGYRNFPASQDLDLWLRFISEGYKITNLNDYLIKYRTSPYNMTIKRAYLQELVAKYIRKLYYERNCGKNKSDSYSLIALKEFLDGNNYNSKEAENYRDARLLYYKGKAEIKKHKFLNGIFLIYRACKKHKLMREYTRREVICVLVKKVF